MYVPILKNRSVEMNIINDFTTNRLWGSKIIPLLELVQEKVKTNAKETTIGDLKSLLTSYRQTIFIDFYHSTKINNTQATIKDYLSKINRQPEFHIVEFQKLVSVSQYVIPVISYLSELPITDIQSQIKTDVAQLRNSFSTLAFRIQSSNFEELSGLLESLLRKQDYLLLDLGHAPYSNPVFNMLWKKLANLKKEKNTTIIILNDNRPENLYNKNMKDQQPIPEIDNGLRDFYKFKNFDGFGDYAGITSVLPSTGGSISPAGVFYSKKENCFISFKGEAYKLSEFPEHIAPNIAKSLYWKEFSDLHHSTCPGCKKILQILDPNDKYTGKSQAIWKGITISHYIYSIKEFMDES